MKEIETDTAVRPSCFVGMARAGMTISIITSMLVFLFYALLLPILPTRTDASWPRVIVCLAYVLLTAATVGFFLSGLGLAGITRHGCKGILGPGLTGVLLGILIGIPFCAVFVSHQARQAQMASQPTASASSQFAAISTQVSTPPAAMTLHGIGTFIPAPERVDMVCDPKRHLLYITDGDSVLRYQIASNTFLSPWSWAAVFAALISQWTPTLWPWRTATGIPDALEFTWWT